MAISTHLLLLVHSGAMPRQIRSETHSSTGRARQGSPGHNSSEGSCAHGRCGPFCTGIVTHIIVAASLFATSV